MFGSSTARRRNWGCWSGSTGRSRKRKSTGGCTTTRPWRILSSHHRVVFCKLEKPTWKVGHPAPGLICARSLIGELKSKSASKIIADALINFPESCWIFKNGRKRRAFWQPRCYDHNCRTTQTVIEKINYCHNNPLVRKLVNDPGQWRWSSYNWYHVDQNVELVMDCIGEHISNK